MKAKRLALAALVAAIPGSAAFAAGLLHGADGRELALEAQTLRASVEGTFATTEIVQTFRNDSDRATEAVYDFALPPRATFSGLSIWVDGKEVQGEILSRARAETVYSEVTGVTVRPVEARATAAREIGREAPRDTRPVRLSAPFVIKRDPALLEQTNGRELRLRVAPVPARGTQRVRIRYVEPVTVSAGEGRYVFAVDEGAVAKGALLDAEVLVRGEVAFASKRCARDVSVRWTLPEREAPEIEVTAGKKHALVTLTPWLPQMTAVSRDVVFVLDTSSGMEACSTEARAAIDALVKELRLQDRFDVVAFNLAARSCAGKLVPASADARAKAREFIHDARFEHAADPRTAFHATAKIVRATDGPRPLDLVLVTGPGFSSSDELVRSVEEQARASGVRVFALEVGARAAQAPLVRLCEKTGGSAGCAKATDLARLMATPVLRAPTLRIEGVELAETSPAAPPVALRHGTPVTFAGRIQKAGHGVAHLAGTLADGRRMSWKIPFELPASGPVPEADRLWAQAAADDLLAALARPGLEATEQARLEKELERVSVAGPILTRATALVVLESEAMFEEFGISRENRDKVTEERAAQEARFRAAQARNEEVVAQVPERVVWQGPRLGSLGGGHGGGAGEPVFVLVGLGLAAGALWRRRAA